jgi:hypothetical protein
MDPKSNISYIPVILLSLLLLAVCCEEYILNYGAVNPVSRIALTPDGCLYSIDSLFRVQIANDPLFNSIVLDLPNLTWYEMYETGIVDIHGHLNMDSVYWEDMIRETNMMENVNFNIITTYKYFLATDVIRSAELYGRLMVWC